MVPPLAVMVGEAITVTVATAVFDEGQPWALIPLTEYVVVAAGETNADPPE